MYGYGKTSCCLVGQNAHCWEDLSDKGPFELEHLGKVTWYEQKEILLTLLVTLQESGSEDMFLLFASLLSCLENQLIEK